MAVVSRSRFVTAGGWRTLESGWNISFGCRFRDPTGAQVRVRYGVGVFGWNEQRHTLNGSSITVIVNNLQSTLYAQVQMRVQQSSNVNYSYSTIPLIDL